MRNFLGTVETPPALKRSFKVTTKLRRELPTDIEMESISLGELLYLVFMLRHEKRQKISTLTCENFRDR